MKRPSLTKPTIGAAISAALDFLISAMLLVWAYAIVLVNHDDPLWVRIPSAAFMLLTVAVTYIRPLRRWLFTPWQKKPSDSSES